MKAYKGKFTKRHATSIAILAGAVGTALYLTIGAIGQRSVVTAIIAFAVYALSAIAATEFI